MKKNIFSFKNFINEQETDDNQNVISSDTSGKPETEREAKSRIAAGLVRSLFGGLGELTGSVDSQIKLTEEVKESEPYKGCGIDTPYKIEKTPISVDAFKIILEYLNKKGIGDYSRSIKELKEKRALIIGIRNSIEVKKQSSNQDRFIDALYFIPGGAKTGEELSKKNPNESKVYSFNDFSKLEEDVFNIFKKDSKKSKSDNKSVGDKFIPYQITTVPSLAFYGKEPLNPKGVAIKLPGDTLYYLKENTLPDGTYKMMVEGEKVKVGRYPIGITKFETYKPADVDEEKTAMEIHRSSTKGVGVCVGPWSAGSQVFSDYEEYKEFISKAEKESMNAGKFIYALIQLDDIKDIIDNAMKGIPYSGSSEEEDQEEESSSKKDINVKDIESLSKLIRKEKEKMNSDEKKVIDSYNSIIKSDSDWKKLVKSYGSNLWDDLDSFLSSSELKELNFRDEKSI